MSAVDPDLLALLATHEQRLRATVAHVDDVSAPSRCDGWTRGHVVTHLARNAEAIGRLARWATSGTPQEMYPGGPAARDRDIEAGAHRDRERLLTDLTDTATELARHLAELAEGAVVQTVEMRGGHLVSPAVLPFLRLREVLLHHVDLRAGFGFTDVEPELVDRLLDDAVARLRTLPQAPDLELVTGARTRTLGDSPVRVSGSPGDVLLWLARRDPAGVHADGPLPHLPRGS